MLGCVPGAEDVASRVRGRVQATNLTKEIMKIIGAKLAILALTINL